MVIKKLEKVFSSRNVNKLFIYYIEKRCLTGIFFCILLSIINCASNKIEHQIRPVDKLDTEISSKTAIARTVSCDVSIEWLTQKEIDDLRDFKLYNTQINRSPRKWSEAHSIYQIIIKNTTDQPLYPVNFQISCNGEIYNAINFASDAKFSYQLQFMNTQNLEQPRRMITDRYKFEDIDLADDTIGYEFDFILPNDSVIYYKIFEQTPVEYRNIKFLVTIDSKFGKKIVDVELARVEYRNDLKKFKDRSNNQ